MINFRDLFVIAAGLIGGALCGPIVGVLAGLERYGLGGPSALPCAMSTVLTGVGAGVLAHLRPQLVNRPTIAIGVGTVSNPMRATRDFTIRALSNYAATVKR